MIGDDHADNGRQRYYHRRALDELVDLRAELVDLRRELDQARAERDAWINACCSVPYGPTGGSS